MSDLALESFIEHLNLLWAEAGQPSLNDLQRLSNNYLRRSTINDHLSGKRTKLPSWRFVSAFVSVCYQAAERTGLRSERLGSLEDWRNRYVEASRGISNAPCPIARLTPSRTPPGIMEDNGTISAVAGVASENLGQRTLGENAFAVIGPDSGEHEVGIAYRDIPLGNISGHGVRAGPAAVVEVAIGHDVTPGMFRVQVVASPAGEAAVSVALDVEALLARRELLQLAVLSSAVPSRSVLSETERLVREVGRLLFTALLGTGEVAGRYRAAAAVAAERGQRLRIVLRVDAPVLAALPWEAMYDEAAGGYVCRLDQLVRHVGVASVPLPLQVTPPMRILGVISSPRGLPALDMEKEKENLARALTSSIAQKVVELYWAPSATWTDLHSVLLDGEWHVIHFVGHGDFDVDQEEGYLALEDDDGRIDRVAAHRLVDLLRQAIPMPRLVVLNSCSGAAASIGDIFSGAAAALVRGGVSAVAAMQYKISDAAAVTFARGFYSAIARGRSVDEAVSSGRVAILGISDRTLEWVTPVLYLRGSDAQLFAMNSS
jgi:hypothetical protein